MPFQCLLLERLSWVIWHQLFCSEVSLSSTAHVFDVKLELWQVLHISLTMTTYDDLWPWWGDLWSDERGVKHISAGCQCSRDEKGGGHCICSHHIHVGPSRGQRCTSPWQQQAMCVFPMHTQPFWPSDTSRCFTVLLNAAVSTRYPNWLEQKHCLCQTALPKRLTGFCFLKCLQ